LATQGLQFGGCSGNDCPEPVEEVNGMAKKPLELRIRKVTTRGNLLSNHPA
jgi:hypothetical protein